MELRSRNKKIKHSYSKDLHPGELQNNIQKDVQTMCLICTKLRPSPTRHNIKGLPYTSRPDPKQNRSFHLWGNDIKTPTAACEIDANIEPPDIRKVNY